MTHRQIKRPADNLTFAQIEAIASNEDACPAFFERMRFPDGLFCAACGATGAMRGTCNA